MYFAPYLRLLGFTSDGMLTLFQIPHRVTREAVKDRCPELYARISALDNEIKGEFIEHMF